VVRALPQGTFVERVSVDGTFVKVRLADGALGWIAEELLLPAAQVRRLSGQSAAAYLLDRASENRLRELDAAIASNKRPNADAVFRALPTSAPDWVATLGEMRNLASTPVKTPAADEAAATWFTLAATASRNAGNLAEALPNYQAAAEAVPSNGGHHSAVALAAYELGDGNLLRASAYRAFMLSPETTNACLVFALALAVSSTPQQPQDLAAANLLRLAVHYSRDAEFTKRYLRGLGAKATNPVLARAVAQVLTR
jgi:tetratricopeptide (TPR) repeat protein